MSEGKHLGKLKERLEFTVSLFEEPTRVDGYYGSTFVYRFEDDDGNQLLWYTSKEQPIDSGKAYRIRGTVKRHSKRDGVNQTQLSRVVILNVYDLDSDPLGITFDELCREHGIPLPEDYNDEEEYQQARKEIIASWK